MTTTSSGCLGKMQAEQQALTTTRGGIFDGLSKVTSFALLIIACVGAAGILPGSTMGWLAIGLGGGAFALSLAAGKLKDRKITLLIGALFALIPIVVGSLGVTGILSGVQVGWGILAPNLAAIPIGCCFRAKIFRDMISEI
ncbi:MAG: hypothetical protein JJU12_08605 [Chlamydiales bacterium]|nr:hypothetical protein [Chlamydiales bacterium]